MPATKGQYGITNYRINREPIDAETVFLTYQDIKDRLETNESGNGTTLGAFYGGLITSVTSDTNIAYNGPWYISYSVSKKDNKDWVTYSATRIPLTNDIEAIKTDLANRVSYMLERPKYTKPNINVQFSSAANGGNLTYITTSSEIHEDVEIGTSFTPGIKINWPIRTLDNKEGTRSFYEDGQIIDKPNNELLGYSYGLNEGIKFKFFDFPNPVTSTYLDTIITIDGFGTYTINNEADTIVFDNVYISYNKASYMYYPQLYKNGVYETSLGEGDTAWFGYGSYEPKPQKYTVTGKYRYYWGFSNTVPNSKEDLQNGYTGLLNKSDDENGTITSFVVGDGYDKQHFWVAYPSKYGISSYDDNFTILVEQPDGVMFDLVTNNQNMSLKNINITLGNSSLTEPYSIAFFNFENPIGSKNYKISFKILPARIKYITLDGIDGVLVDDEGKVFVNEDYNNYI